MLPEKAPKHQVARQYPGYRGPEAGNHAKRAYSIEAGTALMDLPCHKNAWWGLPKKVFDGELEQGKHAQVARINATKTP